MFKRLRDGYFALGLVVGICLTLLISAYVGQQGIDSHDQSVEAVANQSGGADTNQYENYTEPYWWRWTQRFVSAKDTLAQWIMTIFTIVAAALLWNTLIATQKMAVDTREIGDRQLRPFIVYDNGKIQVINANEGRASFWEVDVSFRNCGASPGIVTAASSSVYTPRPEGGGWKERRNEWRPTRVFVGPSQIEKIRFTGISADDDEKFSSFAIGILIWYQSVGAFSKEEFEDHFWLFFDSTGLRQDYPDMGFTLYRPKPKDDE